MFEHKGNKFKFQEDSGYWRKENTCFLTDMEIEVEEVWIPNEYEGKTITGLPSESPWALPRG